MTSPSVSVLVPSYNHAPFIERTLRSILKQTYAPKKLIVIDDGSKDESASVIERVLRECPFESRFIARENRGLSATLNEGFGYGDGEYFAYLGSDDIWLPQFLEKRVGLLEARPRAVLAFGHAFLIDEQDRIIDNTQTWPGYTDGDMRPALLRGEIPLSPGVVYRRSALEGHKWNEDAILEDYELYLKLCTEGEFALDSSVLCAWRQHGWNVSGDLSLMLQEWIAAQDRVAGELGISREELDRIQTELKFAAAFDHIRHGRKREAVKLMSENRSGARSAAQAAKLILRLSVPKKIFTWNRKRKRDRFIKKYGKLEI